MKIKEEYLDTKITHLGTGKIVELRFLDKRLYPLYIKRGMGYLFEYVRDEDGKKKKEFKGVPLTQCEYCVEGICQCEPKKEK